MRPRLRLRLQPRLEALEGRALPSTLTVTNLADSGPGSLRAALADPAVDTVQIAAGLAGQTLTLTSGELPIGHNLAVLGPAGGFSISGNHASRVFHVLSGTTAALTGLTVTSGTSNPGAASTTWAR